MHLLCGGEKCVLYVHESWLFSDPVAYTVASYIHTMVTQLSTIVISYIVDVTEVNSEGDSDVKKEDNSNDEVDDEEGD